MRVWLVLLGGCIETGLHGRPAPEAPEVRVPDTGAPPPDEACNGVDDDGDALVDEGYPDADGNGRVDCLDTTCEITVAPAGEVPRDVTCAAVSPVADAWAVRTLWTFAAPADDPAAASTLTSPVIARLRDTDADGDLDRADHADLVVATRGPGGAAWLVVVDGATGAERWAASGVSPATQVAVADVDADGRPEVLAYAETGHLVARDRDGAPIWTAAEAAPAAEDGWHVLVADLDGDGAPEVVADTLVLDGASGAVEARFAVDTDAHPHRAPTIGDLEGDGDQEVMIAGRVFDDDGTEAWYTGEGVEDGVWSALVQLDGDDAAELVTLGANLVLSDTSGATLNRSPTFARNWSGGPCVGDFDGDGAAELAYAAYDGFYVRDMDLRNVWTADVQSLSALAPCVGYDLDADGALEVLHTDEVAFRVYDGRTGAVRFADERTFGAQNVWAGPAVGDLDGDGDVEIAVPNSDPTLGVSVVVYTHDGEGWPAVTDTWPVYDYDAWNVDAVGTVPATPTAAWRVGNGVRGAPVQPRYAPGPDLAVAITDVCVADCVYGPVAVSVQVSNGGAVDAPAGAVVALYAVDGEARRRVATATLGAVPVGTAVEGLGFDLAPGDVGTDGFVVTVDDWGAIDECDEADNEATWAGGCP